MKIDVLISGEELDYIITSIALSICDKYPQDTHIITMPIMDGSMFFAPNLLMKLSNFGFTFQISPIKISSYFGMTKSNDMKIDCVLDPSLIKNSIVMIIDDIADSGVTLNTIKNLINSFDPQEVIVVTLLRKYGCKFPVDFYGRNIDDDLFVVGYGLDYNGLYRELPFVGIIKGEE